MSSTRVAVVTGLLLAVGCGGTTIGREGDGGEGEGEAGAVDGDQQAGGAADGGAADPGDGDGAGQADGAGDGDGAGEPDDEPQPGEGEGEDEPGVTGEGEGEGEPIVAGEGEGEGEPVVAGEGEGEGEGEPDPPNFLPTSCRVAEAMGIDPDDGVVVIDPDGPGDITPFDVFCDMDTDGGGWTLLDPCDVLNHLDNQLEASFPAPIEEFDGQCRPRTQDADGNHGYTWTFRFPPGFTEFFLSDYSIRAFGGAGGTSELDGRSFIQQFWNIPQANYHGDVSFGPAHHRGPTATYATELEGQRRECNACVIDWPAGRRIYEVGDSDEFRISWGEAGPQREGWYPWWQGFVALR